MTTEGRLAHLFLEDFLCGRLGSCQFDGDHDSNSLFLACRELRDSHTQTPSPSRHDLLLVESQSFESGEDPKGGGTTQVSSFCRHCRYHFALVISAGQCGQDDRFGQDNPLHHYILASAEKVQAGSDADPTDEARKLYPLVSKAQVHCSVCLQMVDIEMTAPRMKAEWMRKVADANRIREQIKEAKKADPDRFSNMDEDKWATSALETLHAYLRDLLREPEPRKISLRNRRFVAQFGRALDDLFAYLGFTQEHDASDDEPKWVMPRLPASPGKTALGSWRAFLEDVRSEVQAGLMDGRIEDVKPIPALGRLETALGCEKRKGRMMQPANYGQNARVLGTTADSMMGLFQYAYRRQKATDAPNRKGYLQAFKEIVLQADWVDGQVLAAEEESREQAEETAQARLDDGQDVMAPYRHFGLQPDPAVDAPDELILSVYREHRAQAPLLNHLHRKALLSIGKQRKSRTIMAEVTRPMSLEEAYATLRAQPDWSCARLAAGVLTADDTVRASLFPPCPFSPSSARSAPRAPSLWPTSTDGAKEQQRENVINALESVSRARADDPQVGLLHAKLDEAKMERRLIVGLANLRNTCYLNSILQYFYSVQAVRDLVLEANPPTLQPSQDSLCSMLAAVDRAADLDPDRAYVGTECEYRAGWRDSVTMALTRTPIISIQSLWNSSDSSGTCRPRRPPPSRRVSDLPTPPC